MRNKFLILTIGIIGLAILSTVSCRDKSDKKWQENKFKVVGLESSIFKGIFSDTAARPLQLFPIVADTIAYQYFSIRIVPTIETFMAFNSGSPSFNLIPSAHAIVAPVFTTDEKIDSIVIVSDTDFDINHPAGKNLADLFDVVIEDGVLVKLGLQEFTGSNPFVPRQFTLILQKPPMAAKAFEFKIKYHQKGIDNNNYFETITQKIVISKD